MPDDTQTQAVAAANNKPEPSTPQAVVKAPGGEAAKQANTPKTNNNNNTPNRQNGGNQTFRKFPNRNNNNNGNNNGNNGFNNMQRGAGFQNKYQNKAGFNRNQQNNFNKNRFVNGQNGGNHQTPQNQNQQRPPQAQQNDSATTSKPEPTEQPQTAARGSNDNTGSSNNNNQSAQKRDHATANGFGKTPRPYNSLNNLHAAAAAATSSSTGNVEKKFTGRCRLFVGNLPNDIDEQAFKELFTKYGEVGECFLNNARGFAFVRLDTRINAEHAKQDLDGITYRGRAIRVRFASHGAAVKIKNLSPYVSNEYLEQAFSIFGPVERAVVIVDDKGRPTGDGIIEFERKPAATQCLNKCTDGFFVLTSYPKPVIVEPLEQKDDEDGLPEKSIMKNNQYHSEREVGPHFVQPGSIEHKLAMKWRELYELEKKIQEDGKKQLEHAREMLEYEIEQALIDHKAMKIKEDLRAKQEELQRIEDMRKSEHQRRQEMEIRRQEDERRRQEEAMHYKRHPDMGGMHQRGNSQNGMDMRQMQQQQQQQQFDPSMLNQQQQAAVLAAAAAAASSMAPQGNNNRQGGGGANNNAMNGNQQQAMLAQLSALAMVAAQGMPNGLFDTPPMQQQQQHQQQPQQQQQHPKGGMNDHRGGNMGPRRQQFHGRGGGAGRGGHRDDSYPGFDTKRARY